VANLALGVAPLLKRQTSHRQLVSGAAVRTFEDCHDFTMHGVVTTRKVSLARAVAIDPKPPKE
jgi:hypothetical protein